MAWVAASKFPLDALTITPVGDLTAGATSVDVVVNGTNFVVGMTAMWKNAALVETAIPAGQVQKKSDTQLVVTLVPGAVGKGNYVEAAGEEWQKIFGCDLPRRPRWS